MASRKCLIEVTDEVADREAKAARLFGALGAGPLTQAQAERAGQLLDMHWTNVYRLRRRFLEDPVARSVAPRNRGPKIGGLRIEARAERVVRDVLEQWLPKQKQLAHPLTDLRAQVRLRCERLGVTPPSRNTIGRRWKAHQQASFMALASDPRALIAPGELTASEPLGLVQIDHTLADVIVVDKRSRERWKRPWLSVALDIATRCVVGFYLSMERPNAATVALLLTRIAQPKTTWLEGLGVKADWPMHGIPEALHLDNAAEFRSRALRSGCSQYGIVLHYRPVRRPNFGGHVERVIRTLMERMRSLPGATGGSTKGRKGRSPEKLASMTLRELEEWLAIEVGLHYHQAEHNGLYGATPAGAWVVATRQNPPRALAPGAPTLDYFIRFLPMSHRTIQKDGLTFMRLRYWHPAFAAWREERRSVIVRYHPEDLSRVFVSTTGRHYVEARFADLRRPAVSVWEHRSACRQLRAAGHRQISESLIFQAMERQREIINRANRDTRIARAHRSRATEIMPPSMARSTDETPSGVNYDLPAPDYDVEQW